MSLRLPRHLQRLEEGDGAPAAEEGTPADVPLLLILRPIGGSASGSTKQQQRPSQARQAQPKLAAAALVLPWAIAPDHATRVAAVEATPTTAAEEGSAFPGQTPALFVTRIRSVVYIHPNTCLGPPK